VGSAPAGPSLRQLGERALIERLRGLVPGGPGVLVGLGDDTAVLAVTAGRALLATTDLLIEGVHFRRARAGPRDIGWKAIAVNLSDIAAMGGTPRYALVGLALTPATEAAAVEDLYRGMQEVAGPHGVAIVGGDTAASPHGWMLCVTVLGEHAGAPRRRAAGEPGDLVCVTGALGASAAGLALLEGGRDAARAAGLGAEAEGAALRAHLRPVPRVAEGGWLGAAEGVHAMMDLSDGLATDLGHVGRESGLGARVWVERLPIAPAARAVAAALGADARAWAAAGGEDYELLLTCAPAAADALARGLRAATGTELTVVGELTSGPGPVAFLDAGGAPVAVGTGYEHFRG
jgi:thiamine-monophosphate kinase